MADQRAIPQDAPTLLCLAEEAIAIHIEHIPISHIACLPSKLLNVLYFMVYKRYGLNNHILKMIQPKLTIANASIGGGSRTPSQERLHLQLVSATCSKLTELNILCHMAIPPMDMCMAFSKLPNLLTLKLGLTKCNNDVMRVIGRCCYRLEVLVLFACDVTDIGLAYLWDVDHDISADQQNTNVYLGKNPLTCPPIQNLDVLATKITKQGLCGALQNLPNLEKVNHRHLQPAILEVGLLNLTWLHLYGFKLPTWDINDHLTELNRYLEHCPKLQYLSLTNCWPAQENDMDQTVIPKLEHLHSGG